MPGPGEAAGKLSRSIEGVRDPNAATSEPRKDGGDVECARGRRGALQAGTWLNEPKLGFRIQIPRVLGVSETRVGRDDTKVDNEDKAENGFHFGVQIRWPVDPGATTCAVLVVRSPLIHLAPTYLPTLHNDPAKRVKSFLHVLPETRDALLKLE